MYLLCCFSLGSIWTPSWKWTSRRIHFLLVASSCNTASWKKIGKATYRIDLDNAVQFLQYPFSNYVAVARHRLVKLHHWWSQVVNDDSSIASTSVECNDFDYQSVEPGHRSMIESHTQAIKSRIRRAVQDLIEIGDMFCWKVWRVRLLRVKRRLTVVMREATVTLLALQKSKNTPGIPTYYWLVVGILNRAIASWISCCWKLLSLPSCSKDISSISVNRYPIWTVHSTASSSHLIWAVRSKSPKVKGRFNRILKVTRLMSSRSDVETIKEVAETKFFLY